MATNYYHIYQRLRDRGVIFYEYTENLVYLSILSVVAKRYSIVIIAMCQMSDHIHILAKAESREKLTRFMRVYTTLFSNEYRKSLDFKLNPMFQGPYGRAKQKSEKKVRTAIAYIYNNPVEKSVCDKAQDYRWSYLAYAMFHNPFSEKLTLRAASRPLRRAVKEVGDAFSKGNYLSINQLRRLFGGLSEKESEQLCDRIISLFCPIDFKAMSRFYDGFNRAITAINSNTGSEYEITEEYNRYKENLYTMFSRKLIIGGKVVHPADVLSMDLSEKGGLATWLKWKTGAPDTQIAKYLHLPLSPVAGELHNARGR